MVKVTAGIDASNGTFFCVSVDTNLLKSFYNNLHGMLVNTKNIPEGLKLERTSQHSVLITFPIKEESLKRSGGNDKMVGVSEEVQSSYDRIIEVIQKFCSESIKHMMKRVEFIPLFDFDGVGKVKNYSLEQMRGDVETANKRHRDICIIRSYDQFLNMVDRHYTFDQHYICYKEDSNEYTDFVLDVHCGKLKELRKKYKDKLKTLNWV